jgi:hypothetical protein
MPGWRSGTGERGLHIGKKNFCVRSVATLRTRAAHPTRNPALQRRNPALQRRISKIRVPTQPSLPTQLLPTNTASTLPNEKPALATQPFRCNTAFSIDAALPYQRSLYVAERETRVTNAAPPLQRSLYLPTCDGTCGRVDGTCGVATYILRVAIDA